MMHVRLISPLMLLLVVAVLAGYRINLTSPMGNLTLEPASTTEKGSANEKQAVFPPQTQLDKTTDNPYIHAR